MTLSFKSGIDSGHPEPRARVAIRPSPANCRLLELLMVCPLCRDATADGDAILGGGVECGVELEDRERRGRSDGEVGAVLAIEVDVDRLPGGRVALVRDIQIERVEAHPDVRLEDGEPLAARDVRVERLGMEQVV